MEEYQKNKKEINLSGTIGGPVNNFDDGAKPQRKELSPDQIFDPKMPKMVRWVIKCSGGLIKNEKQASYVLIGFAIIIFVISLFLFYSQMTPKVKPMPPELINEMKKMFPTNIQ